MAAPFKSPELVKVMVSMRLPRWFIKWMKTQDQSMPVLIEEAVCEKHGCVPPVIKAKKVKPHGI